MVKILICLVILSQMILLTGFLVNKMTKARIRQAWRDQTIRRVTEAYMPPMETAYHWIMDIRKHQSFDSPQDALLVIGETGTGKTMLSKYLTRTDSLVVDSINGVITIIDKENQIGDGYTPKTLIPNFFSKSIKNGGYHIIDCPPYGNSNESFDVISKYYLFVALQRLKSVKVILTVACDKLENVEVYTKAADFISSSEIINSSIVLVVTKFYKKSTDGPEEYIVKKLKKVRSEVAKNTLTYALLNKLIRNKQISYMYMQEFELDTDHISSLEKLFSKVKYLQIEDEPFSPHSFDKPEHFNFQLEWKSRKVIHKLIKLLDHSFSDVTSKIKDYIISHYNRKVQKTHDYHLTYEHFKTYSQQFNSFLNELNYAVTLRSFSQQILLGLMDIDIVLPRALHDKLVNHYTCFTFLNFYSGKNVSISINRLYKKFSYVKSYLLFTAEFFNMVLKYYYKSIIDLPTDSACNSDSDCNVRLMYKDSNIFKFLEDILDKYSEILSEDLLEVLYSLNRNHLAKMEESNKFVQYASKYKISILYHPVFNYLGEYGDTKALTLQISGYNIHFSRIQSILDSKEGNGLSEILKEFSKRENMVFTVSNIKRVEIFALDTLYIDKNFPECIKFIKESESRELGLIAHSWKIRDTRTSINLKGKNAKPLKKNQTFCRPEGNKQDGHEGNNGTSSTPFFGIGVNLEKGSNLEITSIGGKGTDGYDGRKGTDGRAGKNVCSGKTACNQPHKVSFPIYNTSDYTYDGCQKTEIGYRVILKSISKQILSIFLSVLPIIGTLALFVDIAVGCMGEKGGDGGDGGRRGFGGKGAKIDIINLENMDLSSIRKISQTGQNGAAGLGVVGGEGGDHEAVMMILMFKYFIMFNLPSRIYKDSGHDQLFINILPGEQLKNIGSIWNAPPGDKGKDGISVCTTTKNQVREQIYFEKYTTINNFKFFARDNLVNKLHRIKILKFYETLEKNEQIFLIYNLRGYYKEFMSMERQFYKMKDKIFWRPFYISLLNRTEAYDKKFFGDKIKNETLNKTLKFLLYNIRIKINYLLGVNIALYTNDVIKFLNKVIMDIQQYEVYRAQEIKLIDLENQISVFSAKFNELREKHEALERDFLYYWNNFYNLLNMLLDEIRDLEEMARENERKAFILGCYKIVSAGFHFVLQGTAAVLTFFPQTAPFAPLALLGDKGLSLQDSVMEFTYQYPEFDASKLPNAQNYGETDMGAFFIEKLKIECRSISKTLGEVMECKECNKDVKHAAKKLLEEYNNYDKHNNDISYIIFTHKVKKFAQKFENSLFSRKGNKDGQKKYDILGGIKALSNMNLQTGLKCIFDAYEHFEQSKLWGEYGDQLHQVHDDLYFTIIPVLLTAGDNWIGALSMDFEDSDEEIEETANSLKNVMQFVKHISSNFKVGAEIETITDRITETIESQQRNYKEMRNVLLLIKENQYAVHELFENDTSLQGIELEFKELIIKLRPIMQVNLVLEKYKIARKSVRIITFPYSLQEIMLYIPDDCMEETEKCIEAIRKKISDLIKRIESDDYKDVNNTKQNKFVTWPDANSTYEFYSWYNYENKKAFESFFAGNNTYLYADILHSPKSHEALKINAISLNFVPIYTATSEQYRQIRKLLNLTYRSCSLKLAHLGESYYMCGSKYFMFESEIIEFDIRLENYIDNENEELKFPTQLDKFSLSPFGYWRLKLMCNEGIDVSELADLLHIHMVGYGEYFLSGYCPTVNTHYYPQAVGLMSRKTYFVGKPCPIMALLTYIGTLRPEVPGGGRKLEWKALYFK